MKKLLIFVILLLCVSLFLFSCMGGSSSDRDKDRDDDDTSDPSGPDDPDEPSKPDEPKTYYRVMVALDTGFEVTSENPIEVAKGEDAVFDIKIDTTYGFSSVSVGEYNAETGKLTVKNIQKRTTVTFKVEALGYDTGETYVYVFKGTDKDTTSVKPSASVNAGTLIKLYAGDTTRKFDGWSFGKSASSGGKIVSTEREFEFRLTPDIVNDGALYVYPNYSDANLFYYDLNGGTLDADTFNMTSNEYYLAENTGDGRVKITLFEKYFNYAECASTFWDDGSFTREGYVLVGYNTAPDGTGEDYSLGSKYFPISLTSEPPTLYCVWEEAADKSDFTYADVNLPCPVNSKYAPDWIADGIIITSYLGDADKLVIPERIDGKAVIAIGSGAIKDKALTTLVLPRTVQSIADGAVEGCESLETVYYPDSVYYVSDAIFDADSYKSFKNLYVNATMAPRYAAQQYGAFAVKLCRILSAGDEKMIIFVAGSSTYQGLGTEYLEALLNNEYRVVNYGTTRTRNGLIYLEAISHYTDSDDIIVYAPENSAHMFGDNVIDQRMTLDLEGVNNLYRYVDFSKYTGYFTALGEMNRDVRYKMAPVRYEAMCENTAANRFGDYQNEKRQSFNYPNYTDVYYITFNNRIKEVTALEGNWSDKDNAAANKDYKDPNNKSWTSIDKPEYVELMNSAIDAARASGARVYFGFAPTDANAVVEEARNEEWINGYDGLISSLYNFDGNLGASKDYIYNHKYFYDCAFHVNDYGRTYRTYQIYLDLGDIIDIKRYRGIYDAGTDFEGCLFESDSDGSPLEKVDFLVKGEE